MKGFLNKYFRSSNKRQVLQEIADHIELIQKTDEALKRFEKASLDGEEHWLECDIIEAKFKKGERNGTLSGSARINCHT